MDAGTNQTLSIVLNAVVWLFAIWTCGKLAMYVFKQLFEKPYVLTDKEVQAAEALSHLG